MAAPERANGMKRIWVSVHPFSALLAASLMLAFGAPVDAQQKEYVKTELIADVQAIEPGKSLRLGVLFTLPQHAHIYWRFPGSSGLATGIEWTLPEGFAVSELHWPNPARFVIEEIDDITYGYETEVLLFANLTPPSDFDFTEPIAISADPYWLVCLDSGQCIPESKNLSLELPVGKAKPSERAAAFKGYTSRLPVPLDDTMPISVALANAEAGTLRFEAKAPWRFTLDELGAPPHFFPEEGGPWDLSLPDSAEGGGQTALDFGCADERPERISGVATLPMQNRTTGEKRAFYISLKR